MPKLYQNTYICILKVQIFRIRSQKEVEIDDAADGAQGEGGSPVVQKEGGVLWQLEEGIKC